MQGYFKFEDFKNIGSRLVLPQYMCWVKAIIFVTALLLIVYLSTIQQVPNDYFKVHPFKNSTTRFLDKEFDTKDKKALFMNTPKPSSMDSIKRCGETCSPVLLNVNHLVYNRVPKCGSRATRYLLKKLSEQNGFVVDYYQKGLNMSYSITTAEKIKIAELLQKKRRSLYIRHVYFIDFEKLDFPRIYDYLNLIRDPLERLSSQYHYIRLPNLFEAKGLTLDRLKMTFNECVEKGHNECKDPEHIFKIIPFFCGHHPNCTVPSRWALEQAIRNVNLYFPIVGYLENMHQFLELLEFIWPQFFRGANEVYRTTIEGNPFYRHITPKKDILTAENKQIMIARLGLEYEFYYFIRQRFQCTFRNMCLPNS